MKNFRDGFLLLESILSLTLALLMISTLTMTVSSGIKSLNQHEERVSAHKLMLLKIKHNEHPNMVMINGKQYRIQKQNQQISVETPKGQRYQIIW